MTFNRTLSSQLTDVLVAMRKQAELPPHSVLAHIDEVGRAYHTAKEEFATSPEMMREPFSDCDLTSQ